MLVNRRWDWKTIESLVALKASDNKTIPYLKSFISVIMNELSMLQKDLFEGANKIGNSIGKKLKTKETDPITKKVLI